MGRLRRMRGEKWKENRIRRPKRFVWREENDAETGSFADKLKKNTIGRSFDFSTKYVKALIFYSLVLKKMNL
jgi:hypothetical protein